MSNGAESKNWKEIITASSSSGLGIFALIALIVGSGMLVAAVTVNNTFASVVLALGAAAVLLSIIYFVGKKELGKGSSPGFGHLGGAKARDSFLDGNNTDMLNGRWEVRWLSSDGKGGFKPYMVEVKENGKLVEKEYPPDHVDVVARRALVSATAHDQTTERVYWLEGRLSSRNMLTLLYWSQMSTAESHLVGTLLLELSKNQENRWVMSGPWLGHTRDEKFTQGWVEWHKLTKD